MNIQQGLFEEERQGEGISAPLAERMRPESLDEIVGQKHLLYPGSLLWNLIEKDRIPSMIFWGPPGVGKTTLAKVIAMRTRSEFVTLSAVRSGVKEIREIMDEATKKHELGIRTILFMDEIHRFNKAQQDAFLPYVENGSITLIGATTENPSFSINNALLSRARTFTLKSLEADDIRDLLKRALREPKGLGNLSIHIDDETVDLIASMAHGDARLALSTLEIAMLQGDEGLDGITIRKEHVEQAAQSKAILYDKKGDFHYDLISALHKSMRNSDVQACFYWLARMLEGGEDPLYIARRIVRMASEDVGLADSRALQIATSAYQACSWLGMPECSVHLAHAIAYLALAPKSNALESAYFAARDDAHATMEEPVPLHIRNAPTSLMKELGYGEGYEYSHNYEMHMTDMVCLPEKLKDRVYYNPGDQGSEPKIRKRMEQIQAIKSEIRERREAGQAPRLLKPRKK